MRLAAYATTAALALGLPATASASMSLGAQNDYRMVLAGQTGGLEYLQRADQLGATTVRIMVPDVRWNHGQADEYVRAAAQAHAAGKPVIAALLAWETTPTPAEWEAYARDVVPRLAPYVTAWAPMNEPNFPAMRAASPIACEVIDPATVTPVESSVEVRRKGKVRRWKRVRRHHGTHRRTAHGFKRASGRRARWKRATKRRGTRTRKRTIMVTTGARARSCTARAWGTAYRKVWDEVAPVVRELDPSATLIAGDLAPSRDNEAFMDAAGHLAGADVLGVHPYYDGRPGDVGAEGSFSLPAIEGTARYARSRGLALWATEWALHPDLPASYWPRALGRMEDAGVRLTVLYDTSGPTWDTELRPEAVAALTGA